MSGGALPKVHERLGVILAKAMLALVAIVVSTIVIAGGIYAQLSPLAFCRQQTSQLYFGTAIGGNEMVAQVGDDDWKAFVETTILAKLPDGFTLHEALGVYRSPRDGSVTRERTHVLTVVHGGGRDVDTGLAEIIADYKSRFRQESVLRIDQCSMYRF